MFRRRFLQSLAALIPSAASLAIGAPQAPQAPHKPASPTPDQSAERQQLLIEVLQLRSKVRKLQSLIDGIAKHKFELVECVDCDNYEAETPVGWRWVAFRPEARADIMELYRTANQTEPSARSEPKEK